MPRTLAAVVLFAAFECASCTCGTDNADASAAGDLRFPDSAIACGVLTTETENDKGVGAGCAEGLAEVPACGFFPFFCTSRVLDDRWPQGVGGQCSRHCQSDADCGEGATCCEARPGKFCMTNMAGLPELTATSCTKPCPTNEGCGPDQLCCEELGRICILNQCTGVCPLP